MKERRDYNFYTMNRLERKIVSLIEDKGPLTFEEFMEMALYDDEFGYYSSAKTRIGRGGDFYTSSHLHPLFGAMVGRQIEEMWVLMGRPPGFRIVEMGAGEGHVCRDMLESLRGTDFFDAADYLIIERNPLTRKRQEERLSALEGKVSWVGGLKELRDIRGCFFSNELLDAFPVHLVQMGDDLMEIYVTAAGGELKEIAGPPSTELVREFFSQNSIRIEKGHRTEVNLKIRDWLREVSLSLAEGFVLTIDYGYTARDYYSEDRDRGTLVCYYRHQMNENPLQNIGEQDITAHVNFSSLLKWGEDAGFRTIGFCSQGIFLLSLGIDEEIAKMDPGSRDYPFELARIKKLILPQGMGESHLAMIQYKGDGSFSPRGCSLGNRLRYL